MRFDSIIQTKRDGRKHSLEEIAAIASGAASGAVPDYQLAAWLMAAYLRGLDPQETAWLTQQMATSGERLDLTGLPKPWVDKHSTGGVGDKTTIVALPILAACGLTCVKMSGRGLGITGGTVDKLAAIPGFRTDLTPAEMVAQAKRIGLALTGQTPKLAPADKVLYALRDATATVNSIPLIVSSILSKKLAGGAEHIVLDVKVGSGAFMPDLDSGRELATALKTTAELCGLRCRIVLSDMDQPLGRAAGNALELREAVETLSGRSGGRFLHLIEQICALSLEPIEPDPQAARERVRVSLRSGAAAEKAAEWFEAQGASTNVMENPDALRLAPIQREVRSTADGFVKRVSALEVGKAVVGLGGGRSKKEDAIDLGVGVWTHVEVGDELRAGDLVFTVYASTEEGAQAAEIALMQAVSLSPTPIDPVAPVLEVL